MILFFLLFIIGVVILIKSADLLISGASSLARRLNISSIVIGLTIVAFGTSAPEFVVSMTSAISGNTDLAFANVVGSNIANILLILGASAIIFPLTVKKNTVWKEIPMSFLAAFLLVVLGFQNILDSHSFTNLVSLQAYTSGSLTFSNGVILLAFFIIFLYYTFGISKASADEDDVKILSLPRSIILVAIGLTGLVIGSKLTVDNAVSIARILGLSELVIGLTLVAVGTSLPELVTSITAAFRKNVDIAVGNVVGSNIFNILWILGVTSLVRPIPLTNNSIQDIIILFLVTVILFISLFVFKKGTIGRKEGIIFILMYGVYIGYLIYRG